jgi:hypothetical protein
MKLHKRYLALGLLGAIVASSGAYAATQNVTANISFDSALSLTKTSDIAFGSVKGSTAGTYTISTAGAVTPTAGGVVIGGTPAAGAITITGSTSQTVAINTGSYVSDLGVTPSAATCSYNGNPAVACDTPMTGQSAPGAGKFLKLGVTAVSDGTAAAGQAATPSFTVTVIYG